MHAAGRPQSKIITSCALLFVMGGAGAACDGGPTGKLTVSAEPQDLPEVCAPVLAMDPSSGLNAWGDAGFPMLLNPSKEVTEHAVKTEQRGNTEQRFNVQTYTWRPERVHTLVPTIAAPQLSVAVRQSAAARYWELMRSGLDCALSLAHTEGWVLQSIDSLPQQHTSLGFSHPDHPDTLATLKLVWGAPVVRPAGAVDFDDEAGSWRLELRTPAKDAKDGAPTQAAKALSARGSTLNTGALVVGGRVFAAPFTITEEPGGTWVDDVLILSAGQQTHRGYIGSGMDLLDDDHHPLLTHHENHQALEKLLQSDQLVLLPDPFEAAQAPVVTWGAGPAALAAQVAAVQSSPASVAERMGAVEALSWWPLRPSTPMIFDMATGGRDPSSEELPLRLPDTVASEGVLLGMPLFPAKQAGLALQLGLPLVLSTREADLAKTRHGMYCEYDTDTEALSEHWAKPEVARWRGRQTTPMQDHMTSLTSTLTQEHGGVAIVVSEPLTSVECGMSASWEPGTYRYRVSAPALVATDTGLPYDEAHGAAEGVTATALDDGGLQVSWPVPGIDSNPSPWGPSFNAERYGWSPAKAVGLGRDEQFFVRDGAQLWVSVVDGSHHLELRPQPAGEPTTALGERTRAFTTELGAVFLNGSRLAPPYTLEQRGNSLTLVGRSLIPGDAESTRSSRRARGEEAGEAAHRHAPPTWHADTFARLKATLEGDGVLIVQADDSVARLPTQTRPAPSAEVVAKIKAALRRPSRDGASAALRNIDGLRGLEPSGVESLLIAWDATAP